MSVKRSVIVALRVVGGVALLVLMAAAALITWIVRPPSDPPADADAVVVFAGVDGGRLETARALMDDGVAPVLVISRGNGSWFPGPELDRICDGGDPAFEVVCIVAEPDSTIGEAEMFAQYAHDMGWERLVLVSSDYHLRRVQLWTDRCFDGSTQVVGAETSFGVGEVIHEVGGILQALLLERSCRQPPLGVVSTVHRGGAETSAVEAHRPQPNPPRSGRSECQDWVGQQLLMTVYSVPVDHPNTRTVSQLAAEGGVTHVGPWYGDDRWSSSAEAAELGLCTVFPAGDSQSADEALADIGAAAAAVRRDVERALADPALDGSISMWSLLPEELNVYRDGHAELIRALVAAVRQADPLDRPVYMYLQSNGDERQLEEAAIELDVVGQGNYLSTDGLHDQRVYLKASIVRSIAARDTTFGTDTTVMPVIEHRIHSGTLDPSLVDRIETWVRHDVFTAIAAGADGFLAFSGFPPRSGQDVFDRYNDAYTVVLDEVQTFGMPELYERGRALEGVTARVTTGPPTLTIPVRFVAQRGNDYETHASFTLMGRVLDGDRTVVMVNHANETLGMVVEGLVDGEGFDLVSGDTITVTRGQVDLEMAPNQVRVLRFSDAGASGD